MLPGGSISLWGQTVKCIFFYCLAQNIFSMSGPHYYTVPRGRVIETAASEYLSPNDVEEFRTDIIDAGLWLGSLFTAEYPRDDLVRLWGFTAWQVNGLRRGLAVPRVNFWKPLRSER